MASQGKAAKRSTKEQSPVRGVSSQKVNSSKQQLQSVLAVFPDNKNGNRAYEALQMAVKDLKHTTLDRLPFEKLDYGETAALDKFYGATVVVVDVTERHMQAALFYQLGLRENFDMKNNVVTMLESQSAFGEARLSGGNVPSSMVSVCGNFFNIPISVIGERLDLACISITFHRFCLYYPYLICI